MKLVKFMHNIYKNKLPLLFQQRFNKIEQLHPHHSRNLTKLVFTSSFQNSRTKILDFRGAKIWNQIDEDIKHKN